MTGIRLLMAISLVCSISAFAQTQNNRTSPSTNVTAPSSLTAANSEPWKILAEPEASSRSTADSPSQSLMDHSKDPFLSGNPSGPLLNGSIDPNMAVRYSVAGGDSYCLNIHSYVVARDRRNSDSVHLVGSTTCVPASRFRLRTADIHQRSDR